jgi:hypothetical protein
MISRIKTRSGLVQNEHLRVVHHGVGQADALLVALGDLGDRLMHDLADAAQIA